ncbi:hypothetical protein Slin15195_G097970 [Septoria linicola]|uniref:Myb-like domain-containing protein n=1 Tax=Septoria linicola TaxID=215465 RepID=A0A9Q9EPF6_9PEZI|nr:hypothetical protein Slin15195_G097970 [Septoria linicola]
MSDTEQKKPAGGSGAWTEDEKLNLLFNIIESSAEKINWAGTRLPEGRTQKACSVWLDKQRAARKKLRAEAGEDGEEVAAPKTPKTPAKSKKRSAKSAAEGEGEDDDSTPKAKKPKTPRKKKETPSKVKAGADSEEETKSDEPAGEETVKAEVVNEDTEMMT